MNSCIMIYIDILENYVKFDNMDNTYIIIG